MNIVATSIPEVLVVEPRVWRDERGFFLETHQAERYARAGIAGPFVQDNLAGSHEGALRGLHYQIRRPQGKLVWTVAGEVFDVAVDLRRSSPTFRRWVGVRLSADDRRQVWVPPGFAHGYLVLSGRAEVAYKATDLYAPEWERTLLWNDPEVGVEWPLPGGRPPTLSPRDAAGLPLSKAETFE